MAMARWIATSLARLGSRGRRPAWVLVVLVLPLLHAACSPQTRFEHARSVVLIVIDTLRADRLGVYGCPRETSPVVDRLARDGAYYTHAYSTSPWTVPATASIMTSLYPAQHGAGIPGEVKKLGETPALQFSPARATLAELLRSAGFATALFSANPYLYGRFGDGFDEHVASLMPAEQLTDRAIDFLSSTGQKPFFIHLQYMDLHHPNDPPGEYFNCFAVHGHGPRNASHRNWGFPDGRDLDSPGFEAFRLHRLAVYDGCVRYIDDQIGRLFAAMETLGVRDDALIVVTSDHGEEFWDHAELERSLGGDPRAIYGIGHGHSQFQELIHVPLIVEGPGVPRSSVLKAVVSLLDIAPTVLSRVGLELPQAMQGGDLMRIGAAADGDRVVVSEAPAYGPDSWAVISGRWKLISRVDGVRLLFDLRDDPRETVNLCVEEELRCAELLRVAEGRRSEQLPETDAHASEIDEATRQRLRTLGYIQ